MKVVLLEPGDETLLIDAARLFNDAEVSHTKAAALLAEPTHLMVVAVADSGEVIGRIYGHVLHRFGQTDLLLYEVDVAEAHRRRGVATAMLQYLAALSAERGYGEMWVATEEGNEAGNSLYRSAGASAEGSPANIYVFQIAR